MSKFWIVASHTYLTKVKSKSFLLSTAILLLLIVASSNLQRVIEWFDDGGTKIGIVEQSGDFYSSIEKKLKEADREMTSRSYSNEKQAIQAEEDGEIDGYLILNEKDGLPSAVYKAESIANSVESDTIKQTLQEIQSAILIEKANISPEQLAAISAPVSFQVEALSETAKTEEELNQARGLVYVLLFAIYFSVVIYAGMIASEVAVEKSSRVMEILVSSIPPIQQMFAKIVGIALLSITQMAAIVLVGYIAFKNSAGFGNSGIFEYMGFGSVGTKTIVYAIVFILLGYLLYATLAACLGSLVSKIEDLQQMIAPMTMLVIVGFMLAMMGLGNPEAKFITVTSFIPFFTPMIMFLRVGMLEISNVEIMISIAIMLITIVILAYIGAKVYKGGVFLYGKSSSFKNIRKALALTKNK